MPQVSLPFCLMNKMIKIVKFDRFRDWSLITGRGGGLQNGRGGGHMNFYAYERGGGRNSF